MKPALNENLRRPIHDVRTNNDQEGYHSKINSSAPCKLNLYKLIDLLYANAQEAKVTTALVSLGKDTREQKNKYIVNNIKIMSLYTEYSTQLLHLTNC